LHQVAGLRSIAISLKARARGVDTRSREFLHGNLARFNDRSAFPGWWPRIGARYHIDRQQHHHVRFRGHDQAQAEQAAYKVQISTLATLTSKLQALQSATDGLATSGLAPITADSTYADFTATGSAPAEGSYTVQVTTMAQAVKMRSTTFSSAQDPNALGLTGNLQFSIDGVTSPSTAINMTGKSLSALAEAINQQVPQVTAAVVYTGSAYALSVTRNSTGYSTTQGGALQVIGGDGLSLQPIQQAQNASLKVDNLQVTSQSNTITKRHSWRDLDPARTVQRRHQRELRHRYQLVRLGHPEFHHRLQ